MKYKALIADLDGTTIPNRQDGLPSQKVINTIQKAQQKIHISIATGRPFYSVIPISDALNIAVPFIVSGGTAIIEPKTHSVLWEQTLQLDKIKNIYEVASQFPFEIHCSEMPGIIINDISVVTEAQRSVFLGSLEDDCTDKVLSELHKIPDIIGHKIFSWNEGKTDISVTHKNATKKHAIEKLLEILKIKKEETIGVGDSHNDLPLLHAVGFKIAMGNATDEVKKIADYIAPTVEEDGLADVIEKFILS